MLQPGFTEFYALSPVIQQTIFFANAFHAEFLAVLSLSQLACVQHGPAQRGGIQPVTAVLPNSRKTYFGDSAVINGDSSPKPKPNSASQTTL